MIEVTKLNGERVFVNVDHIETVEAQPDTALVLTNGKRIVVREKVADVVKRAVLYQRLVRTGGSLRALASPEPLPGEGKSRRPRRLPA